MAFEKDIPQEPCVISTIAIIGNTLNLKRIQVFFDKAQKLIVRRVRHEASPYGRWAGAPKKLVPATEETRRPSAFGKGGRRRPPRRESAHAAHQALERANG